MEDQAKNGVRGTASDQAHSTSDEAHSTSDEAHSTSDEAHRFLDEAHGTSDEAHGTLDEAHSTSDEAHDTLDEAHCTSDEAHDTLDEAHSTSDEAHDTSDEAHCTSDEAHGTSDEAHSTSDEAGLSDASLSTRAQGQLLTLAIFLSLLILKILYNQDLEYLGNDGSFYANVAEHVRDGEGLLTDISMFHKGFSFFPHPTNVYPLWPLLLGYVSRLAPLPTVAIWLPTLCYFGVLIIAYRLASRVSPGPLLPGTLRSLNSGHAVLLMLGVNGTFFQVTSQPFTEALALLLLAGLLWRSDRIFGAPTVWRGLELGLWLGGLLLTRSQMIIAVVAAGCVLVWGMLWVDPRRYLRLGLGAGMVFAACLGAYLLHIGAFIAEPSLMHLMRFETYRVTDGLSKRPLLVATEGLWTWIADRGQGFLEAFNGYGKFTYRKSVGLYYLGALFAVPFALWELLRIHRRRRWAALWAWLTRGDNQGRVFLLTFALGGFLSLHVIHKASFSEWNFHLRHGLMALPFFYLCLLLMARHRWPGRLAVIFLLCIGAHQGYDAITQLVRHVDKTNRKHGPRAYRGLVTWLEAQQKQDPDLRLAMSNPQGLSLITEGIGFHSVGGGTSLKDLQVLFGTLGVDYLIVRKPAAKLKFLRARKRFRAAFEPVEEHLAKFTIYHAVEADGEP